MALVTSRGYNLVPDISPLTQKIGAMIQNRRTQQRADQKEQALNLIAQEKNESFRIANNASRIRDIKDPMLKRTAISKFAQEEIKAGRDGTIWSNLLNKTNPDEVNMGLTQIFTNRGDQAKLFDNALKREKKDRFESVTNDQGNIIAQRNVDTGEVISDPRAIAEAKIKAKKEGVGIPEVKSSKILDDGTVISVLKNNETVVTSPSGDVLSGDKRTSAIVDAQEFGVNIQQRRSKGRELGKGAGKIALDSFDQVGKIRENIEDLERGIKLIEKDGATTGFIADFLPSMRASTRKFANLRRKLGLNVVASVTFGALSEGELNLAMDVALPKGMSPEETVKWIRERRDAQEKLATNLEDAALYLADHTVAELIVRNRAMKKASSKKAVKTEIGETQQSNTSETYEQRKARLLSR